MVGRGRNWMISRKKRNNGLERSYGVVDRGMLVKGGCQGPEHPSSFAFSPQPAKPVG